MRKHLTNLQATLIMARKVQEYRDQDTLEYKDDDSKGRSRKYKGSRDRKRRTGTGRWSMDRTKDHTGTPCHMGQQYMGQLSLKQRLSWSLEQWLTRMSLADLEWDPGYHRRWGSPRHDSSSSARNQTQEQSHSRGWRRL